MDDLKQLVVNPQHREVARAYAERREFSVLEVLDAMNLFAQPHLLQASEEQLPSNSFDSATNATTNTMIAPIARADTG